MGNLTKILSYLTVVPAIVDLAKLIKAARQKRLKAKDAERLKHDMEVLAEAAKKAKKDLGK